MTHVGLLPDVDIAVQTAIMAKTRIPLQIRQGAHRKVTARRDVFPDGDPMAGRKMIAESAARVENAMAADEGVRPDAGDWLLVCVVVVVGIQRLANEAIVADHGVIANFNALINDRVVADPHIFSNTRFGRDKNVFVVEFHVQIRMC